MINLEYLKTKLNDCIKKIHNYSRENIELQIRIQQHKFNVQEALAQLEEIEKKLETNIRHIQQLEGLTITYKQAIQQY